MRYFLVLIVSIALLGMSVSLFATRHGVGLSPDSVTYVGAARNLAAGLGFTSPYGGPESPPITWYPPLYPALLAVGSKFGLDPLVGARWLQAAMFGLTILLLGLAAWKIAATTRWIAVAIVVLVLVSAAILPIYMMAWTEPLFLVLAFSALWVLAKYLTVQKRVYLFVSGALLGLAWLTRYAGAAYVATGMLGLLILLKRPFWLRVRDVAYLGVLATLPMFAWFVRNEISADTSTGRQLEFHPIGVDQAWRLLNTVSSWIHVPISAPGSIKLAASVCVFIVVIHVATTLLNHSGISQRKGAVMPADAYQFMRLLLLSVAVYGILLAFSITFADPNTPLDNRILAPVYLVILLLLTYTLKDVWERDRFRKVWRTGVFAVMAVLVVVNVHKSRIFVFLAHQEGIGWSSVHWDRSELMAATQALPDDAVIYSNAPDGIYIVTGRSAFGLPKRPSAADPGEKAGYSDEYEAAVQELAHGTGVIVYVGGLMGRKSSEVVARDMAARLSMRTEVFAQDGFISTHGN